MAEVHGRDDLLAVEGVQQGLPHSLVAEELAAELAGVEVIRVEREGRDPKLRHGDVGRRLEIVEPRWIHGADVDLARLELVAAANRVRHVLYAVRLNFPRTLP